MISNPMISTAIVAVLLVLSVYLTTWPRHSEASPDAPDGDMPLAETNQPGRDGHEKPPALYWGKRGLCV